MPRLLTDFSLQSIPALAARICNCSRAWQQRDIHIPRRQSVKSLLVFLHGGVPSDRESRRAGADVVAVQMQMQMQMPNAARPLRGARLHPGFPGVSLGEDVLSR